MAERLGGASFDKELDLIMDEAMEEMLFNESTLVLAQVLSSWYLNTERRRNTRMPTNVFNCNNFISDERGFNQTVTMTVDAFENLLN